MGVDPVHDLVGPGGERLDEGKGQIDRIFGREQDPDQLAVEERPHPQDQQHRRRQRAPRMVTKRKNSPRMGHIQHDGNEGSIFVSSARPAVALIRHPDFPAPATVWEPRPARRLALVQPARQERTVDSEPSVLALQPPHPHDRVVMVAELVLQVARRAENRAESSDTSRAA